MVDLKQNKCTQNGKKKKKKKTIKLEVGKFF